MATHSILEVGDEVIPFLVLLQTSEGHFGTRNVLKTNEKGQGRSEVRQGGYGTFFGFSIERLAVSPESNGPG